MCVCVCVCAFNYGFIVIVCMEQMSILNNKYTCTTILLLHAYFVSIKYNKYRTLCHGLHYVINSILNNVV